MHQLCDVDQHLQRLHHACTVRYLKQDLRKDRNLKNDIDGSFMFFIIIFQAFLEHGLPACHAVEVAGTYEQGTSMSVRAMTCQF